ncbi:head GIN domain-containing protein [uncultured Planktosalinus sp.]|uniref:head GIN domain-containing protein n=1 Tax=uncultured Planktosalinus sp. TaxID=1810935 RepID=UPI0030DA6FF2
MKKIFNFLVLLFVFAACESDGSWDCIKASGTIIQEEIMLESFEKLDVRHRVQLIVNQGDEQKVVLETGEHLKEKISFQVENGTLQINNDNTCNLVRDYGITKVYVTSPNISQIRNGSGLAVLSEGVLAFPTLALLSEDTSVAGTIHTVGDFHLQLDVQSLTIVANNKSNFFLSGAAETATFGFYSGDGRLEATNLTIQNLNIFQRSSNKMFVHPRQSLRGEIRGVGDVISVHQPPVVEVEEFFTGRLIFE